MAVIVSLILEFSIRETAKRAFSRWGDRLREFQLGGAQNLVPAWRSVEQQTTPEAPHRLAPRLLGQILDGAGAVDARQNTRAHVRNGSGLQLGQRAESDLLRG